MKIKIALFLLAALVMSCVTAYAASVELELVSVKKVWDKAPHNAFTDLIRYKDKWEESMKVNSTGLFQITRLFGNHMAENGSGSIINIGSIQGCVGPGYSLYEGLGWGTSPDYFFHKGGMNQLSRFVASKLGPSGVRCNTLIPGGFLNGQDSRFIERYCARTMLGRMASVSDLKGAVVFLASDASAYVTGADIPVDGGYIAK